MSSRNLVVLKSNWHWFHLELVSILSQQKVEIKLIVSADEYHSIRVVQKIPVKGLQIYMTISGDSLGVEFPTYLWVYYIILSLMNQKDANELKPQYSETLLKFQVKIEIEPSLTKLLAYFTLINAPELKPLE